MTEAQTVYVKAENPNYDTALSSGTVTITPLKITVNDTKTETYNGETQTLTIAASKASGVLAGETLTLTDATISRKDKGSSEEVSEYSWSVAKADGSDSTGNYTIEVTGKLTITPKSVTVKANDATKVFGEADPELKATVTVLSVTTRSHTRSAGSPVKRYATTLSLQKAMLSRVTTASHTRLAHSRSQKRR